MGGNKLWVTGLDENQVTEEALHAAFVPYGDILEVHIARNGVGKSKGFGFVTFELKTDAEEAKDNLHDAELFGKRIRVQNARPTDRISQPVWANQESNANTTTQ